MLQSEYALSEQFPYLIKLVFEVPPIWKSDKAMLQIRPKNQAVKVYIFKKCFLVQVIGSSILKITHSGILLPSL